MFRRKKQPTIMERIALDMYMPPSGAGVHAADVVPELQIISHITMLPDLEERDRDGRTLLINAAFYGRAQVMQYLLHRGVDVHAKDLQGFTSLHAAVMSNRLECVRLLLEAGADACAEDGFGNTPLQRVTRTTNLEIIRLLAEHGADPEARNHHGVSAVDRFGAYPEIIEAMKIQQNYNR